MVQWRIGVSCDTPKVWSSGAVVRWWSGAVALFCSDAVVQ